MSKKLILTFVILALAVATAGTVPVVGGSFKISLVQPSVLQGTELKAGEYRVNVQPDKVTFLNGKNSFDVPAKIETVESKFENTAIRYTQEGGKAKIAEIRIGGSKIKLIFNQ